MAKITTRPAHPAEIPPNEHVLVVDDHELQMIHRGLLWDANGPKIPDTKKYGGQDENTALFVTVEHALAAAGLDYL